MEQLHNTYFSESKLRELGGEGFSLDMAIKKTISYCMEQSILLDYLRKHSSEAVNMLYHEFNMDKALAVSREEGREEGEARGIDKVFSLLESGMSLAEAKRKLGLQ